MMTAGYPEQGAAGPTSGGSTGVAGPTAVTPQPGPIATTGHSGATSAAAGHDPCLTGQQPLQPDHHGYHDQAMFEADKRSVYKHPLFPLLALLFEKCELATQSSDAVSSDSFNLDIQAFIQHQERDRKPFLMNDPEVDGLMIKAIQVLRIHLLELEKVQELCKDFCNRYITCLKGKMQSENLLRTEYGYDSPGSPDAGSPYNGHHPHHHLAHPHPQVVSTSRQVLAGVSEGGQYNTGDSVPTSLLQVPHKSANLSTNTEQLNRQQKQDSNETVKQVMLSSGFTTGRRTNSTITTKMTFTTTTSNTISATNNITNTSSSPINSPHPTDNTLTLTMNDPNSVNDVISIIDPILVYDPTLVRNPLNMIGLPRQVKDSISVRDPISVKYPVSVKDPIISVKDPISMNDPIAMNDPGLPDSNEPCDSCDPFNPPTPASTHSLTPTPTIQGSTPLSKIGAHLYPPPPESNIFSLLGPLTPPSCEDDEENGLRRQKRGVLPKQATAIMKTWLFQHLIQPYPNEDEKRLLATQSNLTLLQVNNWFINARRRILQPLLDKSTPPEQRSGKAKMRNGRSPAASLYYINPRKEDQHTSRDNKPKELTNQTRIAILKHQINENFDANVPTKRKSGQG